MPENTLNIILSGRINLIINGWSRRATRTLINCRGARSTPWSPSRYEPR